MSGTLAPPIMLLEAKHHERGPGKIHLFTAEGKTQCGKRHEDCPGELAAGALADVTCRVCIKSHESAERFQEQQAKWEQQQAEYRAQREQESREWWDRYNAYLRTPEWYRRRARVLDRAGGTCEGCRERPATQVHHLTYERVGHEMLFDLVAICNECHAFVHAERQRRNEP